MKDKRRSLRRQMRYTAAIVLADGSQSRCSLSDISESGARIDIHSTEPVADHFVLLLSGNGAARRMCRVVWRQPHQIGVTFERQLAAAERTSLAPNCEPETEARHSEPETQPAFVDTDPAGNA